MCHENDQNMPKIYLNSVFFILGLMDQMLYSVTN